MPRTLLPVVFDLDDTCFSLNERASKLVGIPMEKLVEFRISENTLLTPDEQERLVAAYGNAEIFREIEFYPGFTEMLSLRASGIDPFIKTNCFTNDIAELKLAQILAALPEMPRDHIILNVVDENSALRKEIDESIFAFVDDSPYNIAKSRAKYNIVPIWPLNQTTRAQGMMQTPERKLGRELFQVEPGDMYAIYDLLRRLAETFACSDS